MAYFSDSARLSARDDSQLDDTPDEGSSDWEEESGGEDELEPEGLDGEDE